jgi:lysophospholipase L1-like esterase
MRFHLPLAVMLICIATAPLNAADDPLKPIEDKPGLPRVLLIGDSISIGYTLPSRAALDGKANVHRIPTNAGTSAKTLENLDKWLGDGKWDVIHINVGLHDIKQVKGSRQVAPDDYEKNLRAIVARLKKTNAKIIWASTTIVPEGAAGRTAGDEVKYNAIAAKVMGDEDVAANDLYALSKTHQATWQQKANVHFRDEGSKGLGKHVASVIEKALASRNDTAGATKNADGK